MISSLKIVLKGAVMGIAEVIPGVSGGTIAFVTGIYERLLNAIGAINLDLIKLFKAEGFKAVWKKMDGLFLAKLLGGMAAGFVIGLKIIVNLLDSHPLWIWSFFFGLILASIPLVARQITKWNVLNIVLLIAGAALVYGVTIASPVEGQDNLMMVFIAGVVGVSALMLPGLSGSFVLLLMGMYTIVMPAIHEFLENPFGPETTMLVVFGLGMIVGLFSFAKLLSYTFKRFPNPTLALLTGFLVGSLNKVWPWQRVLEIDATKAEPGEISFKAVKYTESVGVDTFSSLSDNYLYGNDPQVMICIGMMVLAAFMVFILAKYTPES